jgi:hypothetical protein
MNPEVMNKKIQSYVNALAVANDKVMTLEAEKEVLYEANQSLGNELSETRAKLEAHENSKIDRAIHERREDKEFPEGIDADIAAERLDEEENASR